METCVLLPQEFSLVMGSPPVGDAKPPHEADVQVWSNARIPQGVRVYPFQGTVRLDKLDVLGYLSPTDVSTDRWERRAGVGRVELTESLVREKLRRSDTHKSPIPFVTFTM